MRTLKEQEAQALLAGFRVAKARLLGNVWYYIAHVGPSEYIAFDGLYPTKAAAIEAALRLLDAMALERSKV